MTKKEQRALMSALIDQQRGVRAAAATLGVNESTLWRWASGTVKLGGAVEVAVRAVLRHPEDYTDTLGRPAGRPATKE